MIDQQWISLVTGWNRDRIDWRRFSAVEVIWFFHDQMIRHLAENAKGQMRRYLTATKDVQTLREWDKMQMRDS